MTFSITTLSIKALFVTFSIMTFSVTILSITTLYHYDQCCYAEFHVLFVVTLNVIILSVIAESRGALNTGLKGFIVKTLR
jgi:hypothetical protein